MSYTSTLFIDEHMIRDGAYVGPSLALWDGHIKFAAKLGRVDVQGDIDTTGRLCALDGVSLFVTGSIRADDVYVGGVFWCGGSVWSNGAIRTHGSFTAEGDVTALKGIKVKRHFDAKGDVLSRFGITVGNNMRVDGDVTADRSIYVHGDIDVLRKLSTDWCVQANGAIRALKIDVGEGIMADRYIAAWQISAGTRIFAGVINSRVPGTGEDCVYCEELDGVIAHGKNMPYDDRPYCAYRQDELEI